MKIFLLAWSMAAFAWWGIALALVARSARQKTKLVTSVRSSVTVFKPLPPFKSEREQETMSEAIGSFISQTKPGDEVLVGVNVDEAASWQSRFQQWRTAWPSAAIKVVSRAVPRQCANPKIAWLQALAPSANGEVWLWSDTDVTAPPGFLDEMCVLLGSNGSNAITAPYIVKQAVHSHEMLDALFVNVEFLPGTLLLGGMKQQDFAYGSATAFRARTFHERGDWQKLGSVLADDHKLGEMLQPVGVSKTLVSTVPVLGGWREAWLHYYRWHKTVRWCRTAGYAGLLLLMPGYGWALACLFTGSQGFYLTGLGTVWFGEVLVAVLACFLVGCRLPLATWPGVFIWPFARAITWLLVWMPLPVFWSGRRRSWFAPQQE